MLARPSWPIKDKLNLLLRAAKDTLKALNVELTDGDVERARPLAFGSLEQARGSRSEERAAE